MENMDDAGGEMSQGGILLIEPNTGQATEMEAELASQGLLVVCSNSHLKALSILEDRKDIDVVLVMAEPTDIGGFDFIHLLRHRNRFVRHCPQIIVVAYGESFEKFSLGEVGIDDYLLRPYFPGELSWRVNKAVRAVRSRQHLDSTLQMDQHSGIYTAGGLERILHEELNKIFRKKAFLSLVMFRLQGLEAIHLNHGHMMVEWMERDLSTTIRNSLRSYDRLGWLGRGEYCLLAPDVDSAHLPLLVERLVQRVQEWNLNVACHSHIHIPIVLALRALTVFPDYKPDHMEAAAKVLWSWIRQDHLKSALADGLVTEVRLTETGIERILAQGEPQLAADCVQAAVADKH